jgi:hypothetical protein
MEQSMSNLSEATRTAIKLIKWAHCTGRNYQRFRSDPDRNFLRDTGALRLLAPPEPKVILQAIESIRAVQNEIVRARRSPFQFKHQLDETTAHLAACRIAWRVAEAVERFQNGLPEIPQLPVPVLILEECQELIREINYEASLVAEDEDPPPPPKPSSLPTAKANEQALRVAKKLGISFFSLSESAQARAIGCHLKTWRKTPFYQAAQKKRPRTTRKQPKTARKQSGKRAVAFTETVEAVTGREDEELKRLLGDQEADYEPSPLEADPPDRPRRVRERKRL